MAGSHISLFAGVGMTDIAVELSGYETVAWAEIDPFCQRVLRQRFPEAAGFEDVRHVSSAVKFDTALPLARPLLISGGFPCQDVASLRGSDDGINGRRTGLWTEFARIIREFKPDRVLIENSNMLRHRGLARVLRDLAERGYNARWDCIPATAVGAPHRRDRIWIVAWPHGHDPRRMQEFFNEPDVYPRSGRMINNAYLSTMPLHTVKDSKHNVTLGRVFPTPRYHNNEWRTTRNAPSHGKTHGATLAGMLNDLERAEGRTPAPSSDNAGNVNPAWVEWLMGLPLGWTNPDVPNERLLAHPGWATEPAGVPRTKAMTTRRQRLHALGNGLVPQVAQLALKELSPHGQV